MRIVCIKAIIWRKEGEIVMKSKKTRDLAIVYLIYFISYAVGYLFTVKVENLYLRLFWADVLATVVMWFISLFFRNSSIYDPYWSLTPWVIALYVLVLQKAYSFSNLFLFACLTFWSFRLTINWMLNFTDFSYEDWRYRMFRDTMSPALFHFVNFTGIMLMPTVLVYLGLLPMLVLFVEGGAGLLSCIGGLFIIAGAMLELVADSQMRSFLENCRAGEVCRNGLWSYSRHPNYLGENMVWLGVFLSALLTDISYWRLAAGFVLILVLFEFASIPMMEKRQRGRRADYEQYCQETSRFLILPRKKV